MIIVDLNNLSNKNVKLIHSISKDLINDYNKLVKLIYNKSDQSIDWTLNSLLCRDNYLSNVFKEIRQIFFIIKLIDSEEIDDIAELDKKITQIKLSKEAQEKCKSELKKLKTMSPMSAEATVIRNYLDWVLSIPWNNPT